MAADPLGRCYQRCQDLPGSDPCRLRLAQRFSYVLPQPHLLDVIRAHSPIVEIGAGTGYWAHLLGRAGADVVAYDQAPPAGARENRYHPGVRAWSKVLEGGAEALARHPDRSLLICWPPAFSALGQVLSFYAGDVVIHVGDRGGRTAWPAGLGERYEPVERHPALALDPMPGTEPELSVWRVRRPAPPGRRRSAPAARDLGSLHEQGIDGARRQGQVEEADEDEAGLHAR